MESIAAVIERDEFAKLAGVEIVEIGRGTAKAKMRITPQHLNGLGTVHGGAIFTLADLAFEAACNSHGIPSVAINAGIYYLKAPRPGDLFAEAAEVSSDGKLGAYAIRVTDGGGDVIAFFQGLAYKKGPPPGKG
jgi:acyl-CoA thioesterase